MFTAKIKQQVLSEYLQGTSSRLLMRKYGIKGSATIHQWLTHFKLFGIQGLENHSKKTFYDYSFKIKVIKWRQEHRASYPTTAAHFKLKHPMMIWDWERKLIEGRLKPFKGRSLKMTDKSKQSKTLKQLQEENELLRIRVAYLEKLEALAQKKSQTKKKPS
ncbi:helix-turn-helix domain-containing protein [Levilactobacillus spicheri]|uniref:Transposase n=1 Tax=Levilactobacillus spicheri TaxID=216463 RepID=A0A0F3RPW4_9LACO|nr:helix-turn-helix domain-containing protein [Levilactobacillus spicheri]KJW11990.1 transposase [Levilactobacillus spicheri]KJW12068.1 transposase [Levilactobacillus spicheri]KJW12304.1 transposase [Levilactobacillus spicheri]KJW12318.1 transposase [Levilactobacillus spicheri]KJW12320.1 transposase [Levilactobacillus spicheri]